MRSVGAPPMLRRTWRRARQLGAGGLCAAVVLAGCSDEPADDASAAAEDEAVEPGADDASDEPADTGVAAEVVEGPPRLDFGVAGMELLTPASGVGPRPELSWEPVDGAREYSLAIHREGEAAAYWAWSGSQDSVRVGRSDDLSVGGAQLEPGMTWWVVALDGDGEVIAQSGERPIEP